jgi:hypothetical protein
MMKANLVTVRKYKIENIVRDRTTPPDVEYKAQKKVISVASAENLIINVMPLSKKEISRDNINNNAMRRIRKGDRHCILKVSSKYKRPIWFQLLFSVSCF